MEDTKKKPLHTKKLKSKTEEKQRKTEKQSTTDQIEQFCQVGKSGSVTDSKEENQRLRSQKSMWVGEDEEEEEDDDDEGFLSEEHGLR